MAFDLTSDVGYALALNCVLRLRPGGMLIVAICCESFSIMCLALKTKLVHVYLQCCLVFLRTTVPATAIAAATAAATAPNQGVGQFQGVRQSILLEIVDINLYPLAIFSFPGVCSSSLPGWHQDVASFWSSQRVQSCRCIHVGNGFVTGCRLLCLLT